jgi:hypothetical protein
MGRGRGRRRLMRISYRRRTHYSYWWEIQKERDH